MTRKVICKFWCDNGCGKDVVKETSGTAKDFPEGWIELKVLEVGVSKMENKEFCSRNCMFDYINKVMMSSDISVDISGLEPKTTGDLPPLPTMRPRPQQPQPPQYYEEIVENRPPVVPQPQPPKKRGFWG